MDYYLDFDYTLFDTYAFREELYKILEQNGFDRSFLLLTPELKENNPKLLNVRNLFIHLANERNIPVNNFLEPLEKLYIRGNEFVYDDSEQFLKYLKSKNHKLHLLTWGEKEYQKEKVMASKLYNYFDDIIYAEQLKYTLQQIDYENGIFIDDSPRELEGLYNRKVKQLYRIKRKNGKNSEEKLDIKGILEFNSLIELQNYLENHD